MSELILPSPEHNPHSRLVVEFGEMPVHVGFITKFDEPKMAVLEIGRDALRQIWVSVDGKDVTHAEGDREESSVYELVVNSLMEQAERNKNFGLDEFLDCVTIPDYLSVA